MITDLLYVTAYAVLSGLCVLIGLYAGDGPSNR